MPIYEYVCGKCKTEFEVLVRKQRQKIRCEECGSARVKRAFSTFGMQVAGSAPRASKGSCHRHNCSGCKGC